MKKENVKRLLKCILLSVLVVYFVLSVVVSIDAFAHAKFIFSEAKTTEEKATLITELKELENTVNENMNSYEDTEFSTMGAAIATVSYARDYYALDTLKFSIILGIIIGILSYILKYVECKKVVHYIVVYVLLLVLLVMAWMIVSWSIQGLQQNFAMLSALAQINLESFLDILLVIAVPYTLIYLIVCLVISRVAKDKTEELNNKM